MARDRAATHAVEMGVSHAGICQATFAVGLDHAVLRMTLAECRRLAAMNVEPWDFPCRGHVSNAWIGGASCVVLSMLPAEYPLPDTLEIMGRALRSGVPCTFVANVDHAFFSMLRLQNTGRWLPMKL